MNLQKFKISNKKHQIILITLISSILLITALIIYRTYAIYQENQEFNVIKGYVPDQDYDAMVTLIEVDENGNKKVLETMPEGKNWTIEVSCNNNATATWNYESWKLEIDLTKTRTKCKLSFYPYRSPLADYGIKERVVESGTGLYRVNHENANIEASLNATEKENLQKTEYRYAGSNPNNYVTFNNELWRIIGLVNTPEGQRLKLIREETIGAYAWDTSYSDINNGYGINEWSTSKIENVLNSGPYFNRTIGSCPHGPNNEMTGCDFSENGLTNESKEMIDTITWNTAGLPDTESKTINVQDFYEKERSNNTGKTCTSGNKCTDNTKRTTTWKGQVGLIYPSDFGYATSGGTKASRDICLAKNFPSWTEEMQECKNNSWVNTHWTITPASQIEGSMYTYYYSNNSTIVVTYTSMPLFVNPVIYLKINVKVSGGLGTRENPYHLTNT